jgi:tetratricopeptide (TPR) repeat protein
MIGQTLGHYRIVAKIGAGGMGEVYRAHDEQLDRDVALKVLPIGTLANETARKQFHKEALALAKLNHPSIETVYEFSTQNGVDFLAMELIPGTSLNEKLKEGPLPGKEIINLGTQFVEGLAVAHEQGVVHRDLKPSNLMIMPEGRLKILDFGLAKLLNSTQDLDVTQSVTSGTATVAGTLPYMAPEQLRGGPVDTRSDIYAVGAVLYEMATGQRPFPQTHGPTLMGAILHEAPRPPSSTNLHIMPGLERVILQALEKEPSRRYQSAREIRVALEGVGAGYMPPAERLRVTRAAILTTALTVVLLTVLILGLNLGGLRGQLLHRGRAGNNVAGSPGAAIKTRRSVAVLGFKNLSGRPDDAWLSTALSEMVTTELVAGEQLRTVPGEDVAQMKVSLSLPDADSYGKDTLAKIHSNLNADEVVLGSYMPVGNDQIRLDLRMQDTTRGELLAAVSVKGNKDQIDELASRAGSAIRIKLGVREVSPDEAAAVKASLPSIPQAAQFYAEGLAKLRSFDLLGAREAFEKAIAAEPQYPLAHWALADAWSMLGYTNKAQEEAKKAVDLSSGLSREQQLLVEARFREVLHDWEKATHVYRTLFDFFPDNLEYGLELAKMQDSGGKANDALKTVEVLRALPAPARDDPRVDLTEGRAARSLGDFRRAQAADSRAAEKAKSQGAKLLLAQALLDEAWPLQALGDLKQAVANAHQSKEIYEAAGDKFGASRALGMGGEVLFMAGDVNSATRAYQEWLDIAREIGNKGSEASALNQLAQILIYQGKVGEARKLYERSLLIMRQLNNKHGSAVMVHNLAVVLHDEGNLTGAAKMFRESLALSREIGDQDLAAGALENLANTLVAQGDLAEAEKTYDDSLRLFSEIGSKSDAANVLSDLGDLFEAKGDLVKALQKHTEGLAIRRGLGERTWVAESQLALAELSLEEGQTMSAEARLHEALQVFRQQQLSDDELGAHLVLARALLSSGKIAEAQSEIGFAAGLVAMSQKRSAHLNFSIVAARVRSASGQTTDYAEAAKTLHRTLSEATKYGYVGYAFEARLALGEIEMKSDKGAGRAHLAALEKEAAAKGFLLIARKAAAAARYVTEPGRLSVR